MHVARFVKKQEQTKISGSAGKYSGVCDLLICDEAHRLKNAETATNQALAQLDCRRRILLTGTPLQNDLDEFYAMVDFTNPMIFGTNEQFRKQYSNPILRGREPDASDAQKEKGQRCQAEMSSITNHFIIRRTNALNAQHLPPKLVQVVCCKMTEYQQRMYKHVIEEKDQKHMLNGKQKDVLGYIQTLQQICNHPLLAVTPSGETDKQRSQELSLYLPGEAAAGSGRGGRVSSRQAKHVDPSWSGKMTVLHRLMKVMRLRSSERIVVVSVSTMTLDLITTMCEQEGWPTIRLDGKTSVKKRQDLVNEFNDPSSSAFAFLLSSRAGGCGLNLIGGNRLVLFDLDWNPATDKQAAARCWRDGQKRRCYTYRFLTTGSIEERIYQRQLSKEGLQNVVEDKEQINSLATKDLKRLFRYRGDTISDTHDQLKCKVCKGFAAARADTAVESTTMTTSRAARCASLLEQLVALDDAAPFRAPCDVSGESDAVRAAFEKLGARGAIDLGTVSKSLASSMYATMPQFNRAVKRVVEQAHKVWDVKHPNHGMATRLGETFDQLWQELFAQLRAEPCERDAAGGASAGDARGGAAGDAGDEVDAADGDDSVPEHQPEPYKKQVELPKEEDLNAWSHHHSCSTIDDEYLRLGAGKSGCISFIFGMEVTWDLTKKMLDAEAEAKAEREAIEEAKKAAAAPSETPVADGGSSSEGSAGSVSSHKPPARAEALIIDDDDDDFDVVTTKRKGKGASKKSARVVEEDSDDDDVVAPPKRIAVQKQPRMRVDDDDDDDAEMPGDGVPTLPVSAAADDDLVDSPPPSPKRKKDRKRAQEPAPSVAVGAPPSRATDATDAASAARSAAAATLGGEPEMKMGAEMDTEHAMGGRIASCGLQFVTSATNHVGASDGAAVTTSAGESDMMSAEVGVDPQGASAEVAGDSADATSLEPSEEASASSCGSSGATTTQANGKENNRQTTLEGKKRSGEGKASKLSLKKTRR